VCGKTIYEELPLSDYTQKMILQHSANQENYLRNSQGRKGKTLLACIRLLFLSRPFHKKLWLM